MARTSNLWKTGIGGTYIETIGSPSGYDLLINGSNHYINFGTISGSSGYGFRDNSGTMEFKDSGGSWASFGSGSSISLSTNGIPNASQTILNLVQGSNMTINDLGGGIIEFAALVSPAGAPGNIQYYDSVTGLTAGATGSFFDNTTGDYYLPNLAGFMNADISKAVKYDATGLTTVRTHTIPDASGTYVLSVNGTPPDSAGDVTIAAGGSPGGSNTELQYNNAGSFGGITGVTTNGTAMTVTTGNLLVADVKASSSAGVQILSNAGTVTALFGAGGGANSTFYGGTKLNYATASTVPYLDASKNLISSPNLLNDGLKVTIAQPVSTSGSPTGFLYTGGAHTTLAASTEAIDINFNLARTVQFSTGALTTQRSMYIQGVTYAFIGASTITDAITLQIDGPTAGTNATITNPYALFINSIYWKYGSGTTGLRFRDNTSSGLFAAAYSTNVTPSNSNHFWLHNGSTTHINATSAGSVIISNNGTAVLTVGSASVVAAKLMTVTDTVAGTVLDVTNSTTSAAANGLRVTMSSAGHNAAQGIIVAKSTTSGGGNTLTMLDFQQNGQNATTSQEINHTYSMRDNSASRSAGAVSFKYSNVGSGTQVTDFIFRTLQGGTTLTDSVNIQGANLKILQAGGGLYVKEGTNATMGVATLVAGTVTVSTTKVTANSRIFLTIESLGTVAVPKAIGVTARTAGTSFTITSADATDTSVISWLIVEPS